VGIRTSDKLRRRQDDLINVFIFLVNKELVVNDARAVNYLRIKAEEFSSDPFENFSSSYKLGCLNRSNSSSD
jgi:hypothetical protein